jgi:hypothetical protein
MCGLYRDEALIGAQLISACLESNAGHIYTNCIQVSIYLPRILSLPLYVTRLSVPRLHTAAWLLKLERIWKDAVGDLRRY